MIVNDVMCDAQSQTRSTMYLPSNYALRQFKRNPSVLVQAEGVGDLGRGYM